MFHDQVQAHCGEALHVVMENGTSVIRVGLRLSSGPVGLYTVPVASKAHIGPQLVRAEIVASPFVYRDRPILQRDTL